MKHSIWPPNYPPPMPPTTRSRVPTCASTYFPCAPTPPLIDPQIQTQERNLANLYAPPLSPQDRVTMLMNGETHLGAPPNTTIPQWLYPCLYTSRPCQCLTRLKSDILIILTTSFQNTTLYTLKIIVYTSLKSPSARTMAPTQPYNAKQNLNTNYQQTHWRTLVILTILTTRIK